jgi:predicted O-methyltransferase YrrM
LSPVFAREANNMTNGKQESAGRSHRGTRALAAILGLAALAWVGFAVAFAVMTRAGAAGFMAGLVFVPRYAIEEGVDRLFPDRHFAGLDDTNAVTAVLRGRFNAAVRPSDGRFLHDLVAQRHYRRALDLGTAEGYAALWLGLAMRKTGGRVTTIEIDPALAATARSNLHRAGLSGIVDVRTADALAEIPRLDGDFDLVFIDLGVPGINKRVLDAVHGRLVSGGAIVAHNASAFHATQPDFLEAIDTDTTLRTEMVPTASGGMTVSYRKPFREAPGRARE